MVITFQLSQQQTGAVNFKETQYNTNVTFDQETFYYLVFVITLRVSKRSVATFQHINYFVAHFRLKGVFKNHNLNNNSTLCLHMEPELNQQNHLWLPNYKWEMFLFTTPC